MKKICCFLSALLLFLSAVGCQNLSNNSSSSLPFESSSSQTQSSKEENNNGESYAGTETYNVGFGEFAEYQQFYKDFVTGNTERYYMPKVEHGELFQTIVYRFMVHDVDSIELEYKKNKTNFPDGQMLFFHFYKLIIDQKSNSAGENLSGTEEDGTGDELLTEPMASISGECYDISAYNFDFSKAKLTLARVDEYFRDDFGVEEYSYKYEIRIGEVILCSIDMTVTALDTKDYVQELQRWLLPDNYIV